MEPCLKAFNRHSSRGRNLHPFRIGHEQALDHGESIVEAVSGKLVHRDAECQERHIHCVERAVCLKSEVL